MNNNNNNFNQGQQPERGFGMFRFGARLTAAVLEAKAPEQQQQQQQIHHNHNNNFGSIEAIQNLVRTANSDHRHQNQQQQQQLQQPRNMLSFSRPANNNNNNYNNNNNNLPVNSNNEQPQQRQSKYSATPPIGLTAAMQQQQSNYSNYSSNNNINNYHQHQKQQQSQQQQPQELPFPQNSRTMVMQNCLTSRSGYNPLINYHMFTLDDKHNRFAWQEIYADVLTATASQVRPPFDDASEFREKMSRELEALAANIQTRKRTALLRKRSLADYERALRDLGENNESAQKALELWKVLDETSATVSSNLQAIRDRFEKEHQKDNDEDADDEDDDDDVTTRQKRYNSNNNHEVENNEKEQQRSTAQGRRKIQQSMYEKQHELLTAAGRGELTVEEAMMILKRSGEFHGKLMPFQEESLAFFLNLNARGAAGLNADEMGLGKSCQSISILVATRHLKRLEIVAKLKKQEKENYKAVKHTKAVKNFSFSTLDQLFEKAESMLPPALFIVPLSTSSSWAQEFQTFAPTLRVGNYGSVETNLRGEMFAEFFSIKSGGNNNNAKKKNNAVLPKRRKRKDETSSEEEDDEEDSDDDDSEDSSDESEEDDDDDDSSDDRRRKKRTQAARLRKAQAIKKQQQQQQKKQNSNDTTNNNVLASKYKFDVLILPHHFFSQSGRQLYLQYFSKLASVQWFYMIIDEAHRIKNESAALTIALQQFQLVEHRLVLTGTPLQNSLDELWTLLSFLLPEVFSKNQFASLFKAIADLHAIPNLSQAVINKKSVAAAAASKKKSSSSSSRQQQQQQQKPILSEAEQQQAQALAEERQFLLCRKIHDVLLPLMIRREKHDVIQELPKLREWYVVCPNTALQKYESQLFLTKNAESKNLKEQRKKWSRKGVLANNEFTASLVDAAENENEDGEENNTNNNFDDENSLNNFCERRLALHPFMLRVPQDVKRSLCDEDVQVNLFKGSGKFIILDLFLKFVFEYNQKFLEKQRKRKNDENIIEEGEEGEDPEAFHHQHKVLIFSQFSSLLELVETHVGWCRNWPYLKLDGSTGDRPKLLHEFKTNDDQFIFLLTKGAGGVGLNLQSADTVILLDIDYNPTIDQQSLSRAFRVGQKNEVLVLKLISDFAAEKRVMETASRKQDLENKIVHAGKFDIKAGDEERDKILRQMVSNGANNNNNNNSKNNNGNDDDEDGDGAIGEEDDLGVVNAATRSFQVSRIKIDDTNNNSKINSVAATPNLMMATMNFPSFQNKEEQCEKIRNALKKEILRFFPRTNFERKFLMDLIEGKNMKNSSDDDAEPREEDFLGEAVEALFYNNNNNNNNTTIANSSKPPANIPASLLLPVGTKWKSGTLDLTADSAKKDQEELLAPRQGKVAAEKAFQERRRMIEEGLISSDDDLY